MKREDELRVRMIPLRLESAARGFASDADLARALGIELTELDGWRAGELPDDLSRDRLVALDATVELLSTYLSPSSIPKWLNGLNAHLGDRRPVSVLMDGDLSEVVAAI